MIRIIRNFELTILLNESSKTINVFEAMVLKLNKLNEKLFVEKSKRLNEVIQLQLEIEMINNEANKNKKVSDKITKFIND